MTAQHKCSGKTWSDIGHNRIYQCSRNATVERGGKWYCWQHDPIRVEADKKKRRTARLAKMDGLYTRRARNAKLAALVTMELASLLIRLSSNAHARADIATDPSASWVSRCRKDAWAGRTLAAKIREMLDDSQA